MAGVHEAFLQVALDLIELEKQVHPEKFVPGCETDGGDDSEPDSRRSSSSTALAVTSPNGQAQNSDEEESRCCS